MSDQLVESASEDTPELTAASTPEDPAKEAAAEGSAAEASSAEETAPAEAAPAGEVEKTSADKAVTAEKASPEETAPEEKASSEEKAVSKEKVVSEEKASSEEETAAEEKTAPAAEEAAPEEKTEASAEDTAAEEQSTSDEKTAASAEKTESVDAKAEGSGETTVAPAAASAEPKADAAKADPAQGEKEAKSDAEKDDKESDAAMIALQKALDEKALVEGQVIGWNKGGYHVAIGKIAAFCPVSQIEIGNPRGPKRYLDKTFKFRIIEIQDGGRRVVVSRSAALEAERNAKAAEVRGKLVKGAVLEGRVSSLTDFGAFVNLGGGIEGLVHISEISRRRVEHPKDVLKHRQKVKVSVLKVENDGDRISLSMKALEDDPWKGVAERYSPGDAFEGTILRKTDFGLFIEVESGLEGLAHVSRLPIGVDPDDESLAEGQKVKGWVHEVDAKRRRLSLSLREVSTDDPWKGIGDRLHEGEVVTGKVERVANFGAFVELEPGLTGLLSFSALSAPPNANLRRQYHPGREVKVRILSIDKGRRRISLGTELSKAEGSTQDYREYLKQQKKDTGGLNALAAAFEKLKSR